MRSLVRASLPLGKGVILDPFMGSGSTIAAANNQGLKSVGVELDEKYFLLARSSIRGLSKLQLNGSAIIEAA
jgi:site-specific DNA-methyltransferase (adenine-specific)